MSDMHKMERLPAVPLITCDPYFSLWSGSDCLYDTDTMHWAGAVKRMSGTVKIDGKEYRFAGASPQEALLQTDLAVSATRTCYTFEGAGIGLKANFWTPLLLEDPELVSRPCSYVDVEVVSLDGKAHQIQVHWLFDGGFCFDGKEPRPMTGGSYPHEDRCIAWMGQKKQTPLGHSGDSVTMDWGYLYLAVRNNGQAAVAYRQESPALTAEFTFSVEEGKEGRAELAVAYDDVASIFYFGRIMPGYWA